MTREEAIEILRDTPIDIRSAREDDIHTLYATAQNMAIEALQADAVEVVRCKDCRYGEIDDEAFPWQYFCGYTGDNWNDENHFCGYGERKDGS